MYETINLRTSENPKNINLGKTMSKEERNSYLKLLRENQDVFVWSDQEMKNYDTHIIQHTISLKSRVKPIQQNL
jgi:hypothetical protein